MPLFLTSLVFDGIHRWLDEHDVGPSVAVIGNAGRELDEADAIIAMACEALTAGGRRSQVVDVTQDSAGILERAQAIVITGGDPFRLLADLRASGADRIVTAAHRRAIPIAGQSAGALVCGPTLAPAVITSPFTPAPGADLRGLELTPRLLLPHHGRPGRNDLHRQAAVSHGDEAALEVLWDDEVMQIDKADWSIHRAGYITRPGRHGDAAAVAEIFHLAARRAWAPFLGAERLDQAPRDPKPWLDRVARSTFLVAEDPQGLAGFSYHRPASEPGVGEMDLLYTHPRLWGAGIGRRLLERATWQMLAAGFHEAILWTEARNERALAIYRAQGWRADGAVDERDYLGVPIRNLRLRLDLTRHGGGR